MDKSNQISAERIAYNFGPPMSRDEAFKRMKEDSVRSMDVDRKEASPIEDSLVLMEKALVHIETRVTDLEACLRSVIRPREETGEAQGPGTKYPMVMRGESDLAKGLHALTVRMNGVALGLALLKRRIEL